MSLFLEMLGDGQSGFGLIWGYRELVLHRLENFKSRYIANSNGEVATGATEFSRSIFIKNKAYWYSLLIFKAIWTYIFDAGQIVVNAFFYRNAPRWVRSAVVNLVAVPFILLAYLITEPLIFIIEAYGKFFERDDRV